MLATGHRHVGRVLLEDVLGALTAACLCGRVQDSRSEVEHLRKQKEELCAQIRDLSLPVHLASESLPDLKKQLRLLEGQAGERAQEVATLSAKIQQQQQVLADAQRCGGNVAPPLFPHCVLLSDRSTRALRWSWRG